MKPAILFALIIFLLTACASPTATPTLSPTATLTIPAPSRTLPSSATPLPTVTPLPTIPTFTPTFDARTIVTVTPAAKAECPKEEPKVLPDFPYCDANRTCSGGPYNDAILNYLNLGGTLDKLKTKKWGKIADLTGDGSQEMVFSEFGKLFIYGCSAGKYKTIFELEGTQHEPYVDEIIDLNKNGIPELIISNHERRYFHSIRLIEWNESEFLSLIEIKVMNYTYTPAGKISIYDWFGGTGFDYKITDITRDGFKEVIAVDEVPVDPSVLSSGLPWRNETLTLGWNGEHFVIIKKEQYTSAIYRFQAVQDADRLTLAQDYAEALRLYQNIIFDDHLDWWSKDRKFYESKTTLDTWFHDAQKWFIETATPFPTLPPVSPDITEYPRLAAYAYYRIILLHTHLGQMDEAQTQYATLQAKYPAGSPGHPYAEMAAAFLDSYQSTQKMYNACAAAIAYADTHPEILTPLGSDYHGWQSHTYTPADVCPFR